jgi:hypothetical protein
LGNYCKWDVKAKKFVSLGITDRMALLEYLKDLTPAERDTIVFVTSPNGAISGIPAGHSVELHDLIAGTQFKVEERENEIPRGYTLRLLDGYQRTDAGHEQNYGTTPVIGTIQTDNDPAILVSNQKGWGLTVKKVWTDKDFMSKHGPIYMAVFVKSGADDTTTGTLLEDSVRKLEHPSDEIYYFFGNLQAGIPFRYYTIYEVTCKETTDEEGKVVYTDEPFVWSYEDGVFSAETKVTYTFFGRRLGLGFNRTVYLTRDGAALTVSLNSGDQATFLKRGVVQ